MTVIAFSVPFIKAKERPRFSRHAYTPKKTEQAERAVRDAYKGACVRKFGHVVTAPEGVPVTVCMAVRKAAPKNRPKYLPKLIWDIGRWAFTSTPDLDNVVKLVCDALNPVTHWDKAKRKTIVDEYVAWHDDAQITELYSKKLDTTRGAAAATYVFVSWKDDI